MTVLLSMIMGNSPLNLAELILKNWGLIYKTDNKSIKLHVWLGLSSHYLFY